MGDFDFLRGAEISPARTGFLDALRESYNRYTRPDDINSEAGLETPIFSEPIKEWTGRQGFLGKIASGFIPGNRGEAILGTAAAALPIAKSLRGPEILESGATAADDIIKAYRWGDNTLKPGNWVEAASSSKPLNYLLSTKWVPSVTGSQFSRYGSGVAHAVRRGDLASPTGMGSFLANLMGQRKFMPAM
jgi:hypothetical protein